MKTRIFKVTVLAVFAFITGVNVYKAQTKVQLTDNQLKNVEALASGEGVTSSHSCVTKGIYCELYLNGEKVFASTTHRVQL